MTDETAHIARAAAALDDPHAALSQHMYGDGEDKQSPAPERIWAATVKQGYGEWQDVTDGLPKPVEYVRADMVAALVTAAQEMIEGYDWWKVDTYDRCQSVIEEGVDDLRSALAAYRATQGGRDE